MGIKRSLSESEDERMTEEYQQEIPPELNGWSKDEKFDLNIGLKYNGYNVVEIQKRIPGKTLEQIQAAIDYFKAELQKKIASHPLSQRQKRKMKPPPQVPLAKWAELMANSYDYKDLQTDIAAAVRIIADFENFPHMSSCSGIDFKKIYHYIADAMEGKPLPQDQMASNVFNHVIMEASAISKSFIPVNELLDILGSLCNDFCFVNIPSQNGRLFALRQLAIQKNYNPMNVPEKYLKHPSLTELSLSNRN